MSSPDPHDELASSVLASIRKLGNRAALFGQAVAERLGLAGTDVDCLEILSEEGPLTVGRLAELTGLTTGSATRMVDRLEQGGWVRRTPDPADRRRVLVEPVPGVMAKVGAMHRGIAEAQRQVIDAYDAEQLRVIDGFLTRSVEVARQETARLRAPAEEEAAGGASYAAPVAGVTSARLVFVSGAPNIAIHGGSTLAELYRARFEGAVPRMRVRGGVVTVAYPRFAWFDWRAHVGDVHVDMSAHWRKDRGEIALNARVGWAIEMRGGASRLSADLRGLRLESFELRGGANRVDVHLPEPVGVVPVRIAGGMSQAALHRPRGAAAVVDVRGGVTHMSLDGEHVKGTGRLALETRHASRAPNRFEIEVTGGAGRVSLDER